MSALGAWGDRDVIRRLRDDTRVWAVVGLSDNARRPAHGVARFLQSQGKRIVPVHLKARHTPFEVHGEQGYPTLAAAREAVGPIDVVDVFVRAELCGTVVDEAIGIAARAVWLQLTVVDEEAAARAQRAGLDVVMDRCPAIEWPKLPR
ncbi:MAG: CoA-binding protein [Actinomycetes bacterium]